MEKVVATIAAFIIVDSNVSCWELVMLVHAWDVIFILKVSLEKGAPRKAKSCSWLYMRKQRSMPDQSHWFVNLPEIYFQIHQKNSNTILEIPSALVFDIFSIIICFYTTPWQ